MSSRNDIDLLKLDADAGRRLLKKLILDANPELSNPAVNFFEKMNVLRRWVARIIPHGRLTEIHEHTVLYNLTACLAGKGAVLCAGFAEILGYVYGLFGLCAVTYNHGIPGVYTHVVTLAGEADDDDPYVQDAASNATYVHPDGTPMTFGAMCGLLKAHRSTEIVRIVDSGKKTRVKSGFLCPSRKISSDFTEDFTDFVRWFDVYAGERCGTLPVAKNWFFRYGLPCERDYLFLSRLNAALPAGSVTSSENMIAFVKNSTFLYQGKQE